MIHGKLHVAGGFGDNSGYTSVTKVYDPATNAWTTLAPIPTPVAGPGIAVACGKLFVIGGNASGTIVSTVQVCDPVANSWSTFTPLPSATDSLGAARVYIRVYAFWGSSNGSNFLATNQVIRACP